MKFYLTFGSAHVQYHRERTDHYAITLPLSAGGWVGIKCDNYEMARQIAHAFFQDKWSSIYFDDDFPWELFLDGECYVISQEHPNSWALTPPDLQASNIAPDEPRLPRMTRNPDGTCNLVGLSHTDVNVLDLACAYGTDADRKHGAMVTDEKRASLFHIHALLAAANGDMLYEVDGDHA